MNSKLTQTIVVLVSIIILVAASVFIIQSFFPQKKASSSKTEEKQITPFNSNIDEDTLGKIKEFTDYGLPEPSNLGKANPFILGE